MYALESLELLIDLLRFEIQNVGERDQVKNVEVRVLFAEGLQVDEELVFSSKSFMAFDMIH